MNQARVTFDPDSRPKRHPHSAVRFVPNKGSLVVHPSMDSVEVLNDVAARVYALLDGERTLREIAGVVAEEFDVSAERALEDAQAFVATLHERGMLDATDAAPTSAGDPT